MKVLDIIGALFALFALMCLTGYDCPDCNMVEQTIALVVSACISLVCFIISYKQGDEL